MSCQEWVREEEDEDEMKPGGEVRSGIMMHLLSLPSELEENGD